MPVCAVKHHARKVCRKFATQGGRCKNQYKRSAPKVRGKFAAGGMLQKPMQIVRRKFAESSPKATSWKHFFRAKNEQYVYTSKPSTATMHQVKELFCFAFLWNAFSFLTIFMLATEGLVSPHSHNLSALVSHPSKREFHTCASDSVHDCFSPKTRNLQFNIMCFWTP